MATKKRCDSKFYSNFESADRMECEKVMNWATNSMLANQTEKLHSSEHRKKHTTKLNAKKNNEYNDKQVLFSIVCFDLCGFSWQRRNRLLMMLKCDWIRSLFVVLQKAMWWIELCAVILSDTERSSWMTVLWFGWLQFNSVQNCVCWSNLTARRAIMVRALSTSACEIPNQSCLRSLDYFCVFSLLNSNACLLRANTIYFDRSGRETARG